MRKLKTWHLLILMGSVLLVAALAALQAFTLAWLASFPEQSSRLEALELKIWIYAAIAFALVVIDMGLLVAWVKRVKALGK